MSDQSQEIAGLHVTVRLLTERIEQLEQVVSRLAPEPVAPTEPVAPPEPPRAEPWASRPASAPPATPAPEEPQAEAWADLPALQPPPPPRPPSPPFDWGKLAEQLFAARTLAWAGGVATALGIVLLFVMAASRGWITPSMRVGLGVLVSLGLLGAAARARPPHVALGRHPGRRRRRDRRPLREPLGRDLALPPRQLAGSRAARRARSPRSRSAVAIRIKQEPLALFGMSAAMLAPLLVSHDVTTGGVLFGAVMVAASLPLLVRFGWRHLVTSVWVIGLAETLGLLALSSQHLGFGGPVIAAAVMAVLFVTLTFLLELRPADRARLTVLGSLTGASAFTISLAAAFFYGGVREVSGHSLSGITLAGLAVVWALIAAIPFAVRRPHADLADGLAGFALASAAIATGLLAGGPALVCAWTAESAVLVLLAERISRRSGTRGLRAIVSAAIYLLLAIMATLSVLQPLPQTLPHIGAGSHGGSIALVAVALAGIMLCFGLRTVQEAGARRGVARARPGARLPAPLGPWSRVGRDRLRRHGRHAPDLPPHAPPGELDAGVGLPRGRIGLVDRRRGRRPRRDRPRGRSRHRLEPPR